MENLEEIVLHLKSGIEEGRLDNPDIKQIEHEFWEITDHLDLRDEVIKKLD